MKVSRNKAIKAYKAFNSDWTCKGFHYEVGKTYKHEGEISLCNEGFHSCVNPADCFNYYEFDPNQTRFAEVLIWGEVLEEENSTKRCSSVIQIVREIVWGEVLSICNSGYKNSGNRNSGDWNSGYCNSGYCNSGNTNSGNYNSGYKNSGNRNSGDWNSGNRNSGDWNSGNRNSGDWNSGNCNSGNRNSGDWNSGYCNSGNRNSGDWNSGNRNSGNRNSGDWNSGNCNSGYFNTLEQKQMFCFNKVTEKQHIEFPSFLYFNLTEWVNIDMMTSEEKNNHPECDVIGGYLKRYNYKEAFRKSFEDAKKSNDWKEQLAMLKAIPNFDYAIFEEISGISKEELEN